ncbi:MAG: universal stress protein [Thaumarchaeota archaeon]|nr:MAG: universal stress protein [Nitrososphaerota archaeon]
MSLSDSYRTILVAIDGSKTSFFAADYAIDLAQKYKAQLIILHVLYLRTLKQISSSFITAPTFGLEETQKLKARARKWMEKIEKKAKTRGLVSRTEIIEQTTSIVGAIIEFAEGKNVDLIVVGTRGKTGFSRFLLGSVAQGVVVYAHCPVLVVK